jgi:hypothetical protein
VAEGLRQTLTRVHRHSPPVSPPNGRSERLDWRQL